MYVCTQVTTARLIFVPGFVCAAEFKARFIGGARDVSAVEAALRASGLRGDLQALVATLDVDGDGRVSDAEVGVFAGRFVTDATVAGTLQLALGAVASATPSSAAVEPSGAHCAEASAGGTESAIALPRGLSVAVSSTHVVVPPQEYGIFTSLVGAREYTAYVLDVAVPDGSSE